MKVGYPDTINSGNSSASPFKMVDASKADLDKDGKVSEYEGNRADAAFGDTPINMNGPIYAKDRKKSKTRAELNALRLKNARKKKLNSNTPKEKPKTGMAKDRRDLPKYTERAEKLEKNPKTDKALKQPKLKSTLTKKMAKNKPKTNIKPRGVVKAKVKITAPVLLGDESSRNIKKKQYGRQADQLPDKKKTPIKMAGPLYAKEPKKTKVGRTISKVRDAIAARKKRRNDGENDNPKAKEREIGRITRKENKKQNKKDIKTEKAKVTKARQDKRTAKATTRQTKRLDKVTKKVVKKVEDVKKGTGLGISEDHPAVGNVVKNIVTAKNKKKNK